MSGLRAKTIEGIKNPKNLGNPENPGDGSVFLEFNARKTEPSPCFVPLFFKNKGGRVSLLKLVNGRVLFSLTGGGLYKEAEALSPEISPRKLSFPFLVSSFSRMNKDAYDEKKYPYYTQRNSDDIREFFKEITCKAYGKDGLSQIAYNLSDKFSTRFINNYHWLNFITDDQVCQGENGDDNFEKMAAVPIYKGGPVSRLARKLFRMSCLAVAFFTMGGV